MDSPIFPASTEKNPTSPEPNLLNLPTHVLENIVGSLYLNSLKTLRLVCHSTNSLVCESSFYDKVQIYIGDKERLNQVILSHHPWRNFILFLEDRQNLELKLQFLEHFRSTLRKLEVRGVISTSAGILSFLGPELESLHFNMRSGYEDGDVWNSALEVSQTPMEWFLHLRDLNLQISGIFDSFAASMRKVTEVFMENAPNLQSVKFPVVFPVSTSDGEFSASGANDECGRPLIEFLERKVAKAPAGGSPHSMNIAIDWCSTRGDFTGPNSDNPISPFPLTTSVLVQLAKLCEGIGGRLYNVPSTAFPRYGAATSQEMESLDKSVASIYAVNHELHDLTTLFIPHHASLELVIGSTHPDSYSLLPQLNLPSSMNISGIAIDYETHGNDNSDIAIANRSMISNELFRKSREGLTKLQVVTQMIDHDWIPNLNNSSPNLIELLIRIPKWFYSSTALPLPNHDFIHLTDMTLLGVSLNFAKIPELFLQSMTRLVHFRLVDGAMYGLTDHTFSHYLPRKPKTFIFAPRVSHSHVTFKGGIGPLLLRHFKDTVETFMCFIPRDSTREKMSQLLKNFKNLKSDRRWECEMDRYLNEGYFQESGEKCVTENCVGNLIIPKYQEPAMYSETRKSCTLS